MNEPPRWTRCGNDTCACVCVCVCDLYGRRHDPSTDIIASSTTTTTQSTTPHPSATCSSRHLDADEDAVVCFIQLLPRLCLERNLKRYRRYACIIGPRRRKSREGSGVVRCVDRRVRHKTQHTITVNKKSKRACGELIGWLHERKGVF